MKRAPRRIMKKYKQAIKRIALQSLYEIVNILAPNWYLPVTPLQLFFVVVNIFIFSL